jgi:DNA-binding NtrC family response regulator
MARVPELLALRSTMISTHLPMRCDEMHIIVLDDDEPFRNGLAENLREDGHRVEEYCGPTEVPPLGTLSSVHVVITDHQMSPHGPDGLTFADTFHRVHPTVPIVLVTACGSQLLDAQVALRDFVHLCRKPIGYGDLHSLVHELRR